MPSGRDGADERFAAAWDERMRARAAGRRAHPGAPGAPFGDHDRSGDRELDEELRVADLLDRAGRATPGPDPEASRRMRAELMAAIAEESPQVPVTRRTERVAHGPAAHGRRRAERRGSSRPGDRRPAAAPAVSGSGRSARTVRRLLSTTAAGLACILALGALTVLLSRGALPGDMLYGLKRASESTEIGLTSGQAAKARKHLDVAALRLDEIQQMVQRDANTATGPRPTAAGLDDADGALVSDNLRAFDDQARTGARMLLPLVNRPAGPPPGLLAQWAGAQQKAFDGFSASLPPAGREQAASSQHLLSQLRDRAAAVEKSSTCRDGSSSTDELGPLPSGCSSDEGPSTTLASPDSSSSTPTSTTPSTSRSSTETTTTSSSESTTTRSSESDRTSSPTTTTTAPPIQVPVPVPGLPKVQLPPLLPGLPGLSLG